jgi:hypothetical protein
MDEQFYVSTEPIIAGVFPIWVPLATSLNSLAGHCAKLAFKRYTYAQRGAKDRGEYRQATGAFAEAVMPCPLYPQKRTSFGVLAMSALCQKQTRAVQQNSPIRSAR